METNIISVKYEDNYMPKTFSGKAYSYYTALKVKIGDLVVAPTFSGDKIARVSEINIPESKVENIKPYLKLISQQIDTDKYIYENEVSIKVAWYEW